MNKIWYHANCNDGFTAACLAKKVHQDAEMIPVEYGKPTPAYGPSDQILIVDFSYKREILEAIRKVVTQVKVLDHHKTAQAELAGLDYAKFDMDECGTTMVAREYGLPVGHGLEMIRDRDLWQKRFKETDAFTAGLTLVPQVPWKWLHAVTENWAETVLEGGVVLRAQQAMISRMMSGVMVVNFKGVATAVCNSNSLISDLGDSMLTSRNGVKMALIWYVDALLTARVSLRSGPDFDCSEVAKGFGGGGHRSASGLALPVGELIGLLEGR